MKIGILTLHSNTNFGGGLQQIAMFETLKLMGHQPSFLCVKNNSHQPAVKRIIGILTSYSTRELVGAVKEGLVRLFIKKKTETPNNKLYDKTDNFNYSTLNYTPKFPLIELPKYASSCDALVFGSDQIWTDVYSETLPYFGDGIPAYQGKKIAYAACTVHKRVPIYNRKKIHKLLSDFNAISVRDKTTQKFVESHLNQEVPIVCDPTLLYDFNKYFTPSPIEGDYIFAYVLGDKTNEWHQQNIERIKHETGLSKVIVLTTSLDDQYTWADIVISDAHAVDWMNILRESKFVYTNSFHAVIFSLKFQKDFVAYYGDLVRSSRMIALRRQFKLENRIVKQPSSVDYRKKINFIDTDIIINELIKSSKTFLEKVI